MTRIDSGNNALVSMVTGDRRCTNGVPITGKLHLGPPRGFEDLGRMAIYFQGSMEHW